MDNTCRRIGGAVTFCAIVAFLVSCGSPPATLISPSPPVATAMVTIHLFSVNAEYIEAGTVYHVNMQVRELGGTTTASIDSILFSLQGIDGNTIYTPPTTMSVPANTVLALPAINIMAAARVVGVSQMTATVGYSDGGGHKAVAVASTSVPDPKMLAGAGQ